MFLSTPSPHGYKSMLISCVLCIFTFVRLSQASTVVSDPGLQTGRSKWVASWATPMQAAYTAQQFPQGSSVLAYYPQPDLRYAFPNATTEGVTNQTLRLIIKPDLWGKTFRIRLSNMFGAQPVTFESAVVGLQSFGANLVPGTSIQAKFSGHSEITVPTGKQIFSDPIEMSFVSPKLMPFLRGRNLSISLAIAGKSGPASAHVDAFMTSYASPPNSGDVTRAENDLSFPYSMTSTFFVSELDVLAAPQTLVVCAFGDSLTDGTFSTLNESDRWLNVMSTLLHEDLGDSVSVVNAGIGGNAVTGQMLGLPATQRVTRDVLGLSGLNLVIWLQGINDLAVLDRRPKDLIAGYRQVVATLHQAGINVIGATITPSLVPKGVIPVNSPFATIGPALVQAYGGIKTDDYRHQVNTFILTSGLFDGTADFASATTDPISGALYPQFIPSSEGSAGDYAHPNRAGYQAMGAVGAQAVLAWRKPVHTVK